MNDDSLFISSVQIGAGVVLSWLGGPFFGLFPLWFSQIRSGCLGSSLVRFGSLAPPPSR
ncbi:hypothetical protein A2U01_0074526 [Trifolium medium]|uniref:Uncharacterized protein n=1 Tax=Trifolium medium TaxID=97028 RepID=A0A392SZI3_9FABA|nr:hypothetical protein [Trifolium medium]